VFPKKCCIPGAGCWPQQCELNCAWLRLAGNPDAIRQLMINRVYTNNPVVSLNACAERVPLHSSRALTRPLDGSSVVSCSELGGVTVLRRTARATFLSNP
jgi:hypothetical protein